MVGVWYHAHPAPCYSKGNRGAPKDSGLLHLVKCSVLGAGTTCGSDLVFRVVTRKDAMNAMVSYRENVKNIFYVLPLY